eukprot:1763355-Ditylum_brightwellii.AAC.1
MKGPKRSVKLEKFLSVMDMELLEKARREGEQTTAKDAELNSFFEKINEASDVIIEPTNKTNAHLLINLCDYN